MAGLNDYQNPRQGNTVIRCYTPLTLQDEKLVLWTRHALIFSGGVLLREVKDSIVIVDPRTLKEIAVDPLGETRILKGARTTEGSVMCRVIGRSQTDFFQQLPHIEMQHVGFASGTRRLETIRMDLMDIDTNAGVLGPALLVPGLRGPVVPSILAPYAGFQNWFLLMCFEVTDFLASETIQRMVVTGDLGGVPVFTMKFNIPSPKFMIGTELINGIDRVSFGLEFTPIQPTFFLATTAHSLCSVSAMSGLRDPVQMKIVKLGKEPRAAGGGRLSEPLVPPPVPARDETRRLVR